MIELMMMGGKNAGAFAPSYIAAGSEVIKLSPSLDEEWRVDLGYTVKDLRFGGGLLYTLHLDTSDYQATLTRLDPSDGSILATYKPNFQVGNQNNNVFGLLLTSSPARAFMFWRHPFGEYAEIVDLSTMTSPGRFSAQQDFRCIVAGVSECYFGDATGRVYRISAPGTNPAWSTATGLTAVATIAYDRGSSIIYINSNKRYRSTDGAALSSTSLSGAIRCVDQDFLYGATTNAIYKLNKSDLSQVWSLSLSGVNAFTPLSVEPSGFVRVITGTSPSVMSIISPDGELIDSVTSGDIGSSSWIQIVAIEPGEYNAGFWS